jgi:hypothetical protein
MVVIVLAAAATGWIGAEHHEPPAPGVRLESGGGWTRLDAVLPGRLVSYALPKAEDGARDIILLVEELLPPEPEPPEEGGEEEEAAEEVERLPPCPSEGEEERGALTLFRIPAAGDRELVPLPVEPPPDTTALDAADLDGDGAEELLLARPGQVLRVDGDRLQPLLEEEGLDWVSLHPRPIRRPSISGQPLASRVELGIVHLYGAPAGGGAWERLARVEIPLEGKIQGRRLLLSHPVPRLVSRLEDGTLLLATEPGPVGGRRLRTLLIELPPAGDPILTECWAGLPAPETVLESTFLMFEGRPALLVSSMPGDKLSLFGEKLLRLYHLEGDRTRLGVRPLFAARSHMNLWQDGTPVFHDVNGDGRDDLVMAYWKGIFSSRVVLDAYLRQEDGSFRTAPRTTAFDVKEGDDDFLHYGEDLNGDGIADLLVESDDGLLLYPGLPSSSGKKLVDRTPQKLPTGDLKEGEGAKVVQISNTGVSAWNLAMPDGSPHLIDLDGDGRQDVLMVRRGSRKRNGALRTIRFPPAGG